MAFPDQYSEVSTRLPFTRVTHTDGLGNRYDSRADNRLGFRLITLLSNRSDALLPFLLRFKYEPAQNC